MQVLKDVSFTVNSGEVLGIAGIAGCGQKELLEAIAGLQSAEIGSSVQYLEDDGSADELLGLTPRKIREKGVALSFVPEDRLGMGLVGGMDMPANMLLRTYHEGHGPFVNRKSSPKLAQRSRGPAGRRHPGRVHLRAQALRRQRAEGPGGPRDRRRPQRADDRLRRARTGHQHQLRHL